MGMWRDRGEGWRGGRGGRERVERDREGGGRKSRREVGEGERGREQEGGEGEREREGERGREGGRERDGNKIASTCTCMFMHVHELWNCDHIPPNGKEGVCAYGRMGGIGPGKEGSILLLKLKVMKVRKQ